jgi:carbon storage regulator
LHPKNHQEVISIPPVSKNIHQAAGRRNKEVPMLKLTVKAGEYLLVGDDVKVVFTGGSSNNLHVLVDAPKSMNIVRSTALEKYGMAADPGNEVKHHKDKELSPEAKEKIKAILMEERRKARKQKQ